MMNNKKIPLIIIAGPTGIGKSLLGMELAQELKTDIISSDSRQLYKYFDIGSAKPSLVDRALIKHHIIDIWEPTLTFTVSDFVELVKPIVEDLYNKGKIPLIVGGTGLYIKALIEGFSIPRVEPAPEIREKLKKEAEEKGNKVLYERALQVDPISMQKIHENDLIRIIRVLEVFETTGKPISQVRAKEEESPYDLTYLYLDSDRDKLYERISLRVEKMFEEGLLEEVKSIIDQFGIDLPLLETINYREPKQYLLGKATLEETKELMKKNTRNFAKRQLTWFRNSEHIERRLFESQDDVKSIKESILSKFKIG